ncbi:protein disulfide-isomerase A5-like [Pomacea canaliculata]|uniref:protein disulfide-isomerase A5-like n=1 Tax=Pomacea canaliculata TaxID=400727 RepID=UPI000D73FBDD|nr:protein disulfide-isomerase A5-like [Pomacea canaliculata]
MAHCIGGVLLASFIFLFLIPFHSGAKQSKKDLVIRVEDFKDFKKLLRTRTNLLVIFAQSEKSASKSMTLFEQVAEEMKGKATIAFVNCGDDKKFCKKLKINPDTFELKHYKDGEFNKDYDRKLAAKSMVNFLMDPTGDIPWDEDPTAVDVIHIDSEDGLNKLLKKDKAATLVMFYAPWCGYCKRLKPEFAAAATEVKGKAQLVGIDVDKPQMMGMRTQYNVTGFPTLYYFEKGRAMFRYGGENNKDGIITWLNNPRPPEEPKKEAEWSEEPSEVVHLEDSNFDTYIKEHSSVLVMFYAPWCGHCKKMKPDYTEAAETIKSEGLTSVLAAVDATKNRKLAEDYKIKGFPTLKYFKDGEYAFEVNERDKDKIIEFIKNPQEPPPPPAPEPSWEEIESSVVHLNEENFKFTLKKRKHSLVMFYAPWCGHCKKAKPEFMSAAAQFKDDSKVLFGAVDCTTQQSICTAHDVTGYPTFKYFNYLNKNSQKYMGGREENDFVNFMRDPLSPSPTLPPATQPQPQTNPGEDWADIEGQKNINFLTAETFDSFIAEQPSVLVMFYAPWCGHCKKMKPAYGEAATKVKEEGLGALAAVDATIEKDLSQKYDIRGFPTLKYFRNGKVEFEYGSGRSASDIISFMKDPKASPPPEPEWSEQVSDVNHLTNDNFDSFLAANRKVLVMFYAPWCGHCKKMKPAYMSAATRLMTEVPDAKLAAVDATKYRELANTYSIKGFPTLKYFEGGKEISDYGGGRSEEDLVNFFKGSKPPTPEESLPSFFHSKWVPSLSGANFSSTLRNREAALVFFYADSCPKCTKYWPEFAAAGEALVNQLATVNCDTYSDLCGLEGIRKFPTFVLYMQGQRKDEYRDAKTKDAFLNYVKTQTPLTKEEL